MNLFQLMRNWAGYTSIELDDKQPIDFFDKANQELIELKSELEKSQSEFDDLSSMHEIRIMACDKLIEKGESETGEYNKKVISERLSRITENFFKKAQELNDKIVAKENEVIAIESEIITKAIQLTALLSENEQKVIQDQMGVWQETGLIKGKSVDNQTKAIVTILDEIVKSEEYIEKGFFEGIRGGKVIGHTKTGKPIYESHNSSSHKKFTHAEHMDAAVLHDKHVADATKSNDPKKMMHHMSQSVGHREAAAKAHYMENYASTEHKEKMGMRKSEESEDFFEKAKSFEGHYANVILRRGNKILFLKRGNDKVLAPGQWCLPGGHIDAGESIQQAAARELKEEANIDCDADCLNISSKAKCENGKWAFYLNSWNSSGDVALLDGESQNAAWMTQEEWMDADLFFDLKDHLIAMEFPEFDVDKIPTISKAEDFFFELEKAGHAAAIGEIRTWGGIKYKKVAAGKWVPSKKERLAVADVTAHAENTSGGQLKKVSQLHPDNHIRDAAKREIERRKADKEKKKDSLLAKKPDAVATPPDEPAKVTKKKKPEAFKYSPSEGLSSEHSKVEKTFGKKLAKNYEKSRSSYEKEFGHVLNTDNARELSDDYKKNKSELSAAVHEPASAFVKKMYEDKLAEKTPKGKKNLVYFTAGGTGAGKTTGLQGNEKTFHDKAHIVFDTNMNTMQSSSKKIDQALSSGKKVRINYVFRDPVDAFENGAVPRSLRIGRTVPIESHIETHLGSLSTIQGLQEKYKGNKNVKIVVTDNSRGLGNAKRVPVESVKKWNKNYTSSDLRTQLHDINDRLYKEGKISEGHHKGFKG